MSDCKVSDQIYKAFDELEMNLITGIQDTITEEILPPNFKNRLNTLIENAMPRNQFSKMVRTSDKFKWISKHKPAMQKTSESYTNLKEGLENIEVIKSLRDALESRHNTFKYEQSFDSDCSRNANTTSEQIINAEKIDLTRLENYFSSNLDNYKSIYYYQKSIGGIRDAKMKELQKISNKIDTYKQNLFIDSRKDTYENSNYDFYKSIYFYVVLIYYILVISYFIFTPFFQEKKYLNYKLVTIIVLYIFFPFMLPYLLSLIYNVYEYIIETNNLRGEIISYPYIIEDKEKYE